MAPASDRVEQLSASQRLLLALRDARTKLELVERTKTEPIAIVGMGCRFPGGAHDPETFWKHLRSGVDAVTHVPSERWDRTDITRGSPPGEAADLPGATWGAFLQHVDHFDASFFGISGR